MEFTLKVNTETLKAKSHELETEIDRLKGHIDEIYQIVSRTSGYWTGISGDKARMEFNKQKQSTDIALKRFQEHPPELLMMAGVYEEAERNVAARNQALNTDVIV